MKIAFVGKGGSGKTTLCALMAKVLALHKYPVVAIDADINQHLANSLGNSVSFPSLSSDFTSIKKFLAGSNIRINPKSMIKTTPPGKGSNFIKIDEQNPIFENFSSMKDGIRLMNVGEFESEDIGTKCYHSKNGIVELILNHTADKSEEYFLVDMTAGADAFSSGLFTRFDITFVVVEPTLQSISVFNQYKKHAAQYNVKVKALANKVTEGDHEFIKNTLSEDLVASIPNSKVVRDLEKGIVRSVHELEKEVVSAMLIALGEINSCRKNWSTYHKQAVDFHIKNAQSWANEEEGIDLTSQIDPDFNIEHVIGA